VLSAALALLDDGDGSGLTMRGVAARLGVTPMSLYHHVPDRTGLLVALSDRVYGEVLAGVVEFEDGRASLRELLVRYHDAVARHPQLTLAIFAEPAAFAGVTREITDRLTALLSALTPDAPLWRDVLVDHAHGSGLALVAARDDPRLAATMRGQYAVAVERLLAAV
jgi:AcrR family transcriptional regulator